jgi:hypothetical protein
MKLAPKVFLGSLALAVYQFASTGCVATGGGGGDDVYYGGDTWVHSDVIVTGGGPGWYGRDRDDHRGDNGYVHPSAGRQEAPPSHADAHKEEGHAAPARGDGHTESAPAHNDSKDPDRK